jgi:hypothetical protein
MVVHTGDSLEILPEVSGGHGVCSAHTTSHYPAVRRSHGYTGRVVNVGQKKPDSPAHTLLATDQ